MDYDLLRTGDPHFIYYSFNITNLEGAENLKDAVKIVYRKIGDVLEDLSTGSDRRIGQFYIGKTFTSTNKSRHKSINQCSIQQQNHIFQS